MLEPAWTAARVRRKLRVSRVLHQEVCVSRFRLSVSQFRCVSVLGCDDFEHAVGDQ